MTMPERIWAWKTAENTSAAGGQWISRPSPVSLPETEYVRADALAAKDAEIERLRAALEPFSREASAWDFDCPDEQPVFTSQGEGWPLDEAFTIGDLRRARAALGEEP